jgi:16S rRNA (cytosine967-C5)-methyltransferase
VTPSARLAAAIALLEEIEAAPRRPADAVANDFFRSRRYIGGGDRRAVSERAWSVLRARRRLGWWLDYAQLPQTPRLLVAASMLLEGMTVEQLARAFSGGQYAPPALARPEAEMLAVLAGRTLDFKAQPPPVRLEIPDWIVSRLAARFGNALETEMRATLGPAPLDLRANLLKATRDEARAALAAEGIEAEPTPYSPWGLRIAGRRAVTTGAAFRDGLVEIQDEGSQLVALLVGAEPGMRVADWCAGAGGKTLALAMTMANKGQILACDVSAPRLDGAVRRLRRAGVHNAERHLVEPGDKWAKRRAGTFDRVLVDAPCTGTGTWRRNPDARTRLREQDLAELLPKQAAILDDAARLVKPGGRMIYATCSVLPEEDEDQVDAFLARQPGFVRVPAALPGGLSADPALLLTPRRNETDGFFAAVLERKA